MSTEERNFTLRDQEKFNSNSISPNIGVRMSDSISLVIRSADQTRKASVTLPGLLTIEQLLQTTQQKWNLPANTSYAMRLERTGQQLDPAITLQAMGVQQNDVLELYPILEAG
jgi:hypothetical protein